MKSKRITRTYEGISKEFIMTKKRNWLGTLVLLAAFAVVVVGCDEINGVLGSLGLGGEEEFIVPAANGGEEPGLTPEAFFRQFVETWRDYERDTWARDNSMNSMRHLFYGDEVFQGIWNMTAYRIHAGTEDHPGEYWRINELVDAAQKNGLQALEVADANLPREGGGLNEFSYGGWYHNVFSYPKYNYYVDEWVWSTEHKCKAIRGSGRRIDISFKHDGQPYTVSFYLIKADGEIIEVDGEAGKKVDREWKVYWYEGF
jgi:hypothetical protein